eukprot:1464553-Pyramimonas_sp.AAC.1
MPASQSEALHCLITDLVAVGITHAVPHIASASARLRARPTGFFRKCHLRERGGVSEAVLAADFLVAGFAEESPALVE